MQAQTNLPRSRYWAPIPLWGRLGMACLMFFCAALNTSKHSPRFAWIPWLCFGLYWLVNIPKRAGETFGTYLKKPRATAMALLIIVVTAGFGHNLYVLFVN